MNDTEEIAKLYRSTIDARHCVSPEGKVRRWYPAARRNSYEDTLGIKYGFVRVSSNLNINGWRKFKDARFIPEAGKFDPEYLDPKIVDSWVAAAKSTEDIINLDAKVSRDHELYRERVLHESRHTGEPWTGEYVREDELNVDHLPVDY